MLNMTETDSEMLARLGMDADKWTEAFSIRFHNGHHYDFDQDTLLAWFANAIMAGYDRGRVDGHEEGFTKGFQVGKRGLNDD